MKIKRPAGADGDRHFTLIFDEDDDVSARLCEFAQRERVTGHFHGLGAVRRATIAFWNPATRSYENHDIDEQMEVAALSGNIALTRGAPKVHAHVVLGKANGSAVSGHLVEAKVRPTLEVHFVEATPPLERKKDEATGLDLLTL